jgi:hypothetical protein
MDRRSQCTGLAFAKPLMRTVSMQKQSGRAVAGTEKGVARSSVVALACIFSSRPISCFHGRRAATEPVHTGQAPPHPSATPSNQASRLTGSHSKLPTEWLQGLSTWKAHWLHPPADTLLRGGPPQLSQALQQLCAALQAEAERTRRTLETLTESAVAACRCPASEALEQAACILALTATALQSGA